ncbi:ATP-dependent Clp protease proteolytic subunit [Archangium sp.]|uniref:ATP-dependent Clp protease proteolytic subunit n=1 Tax=Archangium sp. TaxID=1872627 RepID=UPI0039C8936A
MVGHCPGTSSAADPEGCPGAGDLNSPGGSVAASLAIRDTMEYVQPPITTLCMRQCHGTAAILLPRPPARLADTAA